MGAANKVDVLGKVAPYSQYDWLGRRFFLSLTMLFQPRLSNAIKHGNVVTSDLEEPDQ